MPIFGLQQVDKKEKIVKEERHNPLREREDNSRITRTKLLRKKFEYDNVLSVSPDNGIQSQEDPTFESPFTQLRYLP